MPKKALYEEDPPSDEEGEEDELDERVVEEELEESDGSQSDDMEVDTPATPSRRGKKKAQEDNYESRIIVQTAFDAYFSYNKPGRPQTSSSVYSQLVLPLSGEEFAQAMSTVKATPNLESRIKQADVRSRVFSRLICEMHEGFNILCYGLGSKRRLLNDFALEFCSKRGYVIVANAFQPDFGLKDLLNSIESIAPLRDLDLPSTSVDRQARRIQRFFSQDSCKHPLYIIIHNIDAAPLRTSKSHSILGLLAHTPRIHLVASVDHINAPLLWSASESVARKPSNSSSPVEPIPSRGFSWLWHDMTTLANYDIELAFADRSSLSGGHTGGARRKVDALAAQNATAMTETAASHILASVTQKAQKLFTLLGKKQLEAIEAGDDNTSSGADLQQYGMAYEALFGEARDNFIATSDTALRVLLGEFKDHNLVLSAPATVGGGEILWIPLRKERLSNVLRMLNSS